MLSYGFALECNACVARCAEKLAMYHGRKPALRRSTRPPSFIAQFTARISAVAAGPSRSNQSMWSMICTRDVSERSQR